MSSGLAERPEPCSSGKRRFPTEARAKTRLADIKRSPQKTGKVPSRAYQCPACGDWHLTAGKNSR